eukprot:COSAG01_NODE_2914_length_6866_cov_17.396483_2_plen_287_part_00
MSARQGMPIELGSIELEGDDGDGFLADSSAALLAEAEALELGRVQRLPPAARRSGYQRVLNRCCCCCTPRDLPPAVERSRVVMQKMARIKMVPGDPDGHEAILVRIYSELLGESPSRPPFVGDHWMDIGFQGANPATDLRAAGMLAMLQLLYLATRHNHFARSMLALSNDSVQHFPFATVSINATSWALHALRSRSCHPLLVVECSAKARGELAHTQCLSVLNQLYTGLMHALYTEWAVEKRTITDFQAVSEALEARVLKNPSSFFGIEPSAIKVGDGSASFTGSV